MKEEIRRVDPHAEFDTSERCAINELSNSDSDPALSIARARVDMGDDDTDIERRLESG
jgi:hypothetical protein